MIVVDRGGREEGRKYEIVIRLKTLRFFLGECE